MPKKNKKEKIGTAGFSTGHDFSFVDSWNKQPSPEKYDLLSQYEDVVYACANINVNAVTTTPLRLYVKMGAGQTTRWHSRSISKGHKEYLREKFSLRGLEDVKEINDPHHPLLKLLDKPNPDLDGPTFLELLQLFQEIIGTSYVHPVMNALGVPQEMWLLPAQYMWARKDNINGHITHYEYICNGRTKKYDPDEIIKFTLPNLVDVNGEGMSPLRAVWEPLTISNKVLAHEAALLDNHARPGAIASVKDGLGEKEAQRWEWKINNKFRRQGNGGIVVLEEDSTITPIGWNPKDLGMLQVLEMTEKHIANAFGVPLAMLNTKDVNRANMIASQEMHVKNAVARRLKRLERILNDRITKLFDPSGRLFLAFDNPNPRDKEFELTKQKEMASMGVALVSGQIWTPNEARAEFGMEPIDGGDELRRMPGEMVSETVAEDSTPEPAPVEEPTPEPAPVETEQELQTSPALTLNGAQIASAMNIVSQVAQGQLPRDSGIGALQVLLNLTTQQAEQIMGSVGAGFEPVTEEGKSQKAQKVAPKLPSGKELAEVLKKHFERQRKATIRSLTKGKKALPNNFVPLDEWTDELADECLPVCEMYFQTNYEARSVDLIQRVGASPDVFNVTNPQNKKAIEKMVYEFAESTVETTTKEINDAIELVRKETLEGLFESGEDIRRLTDRIETIFESAERFRSQRIAQSESSRMHHEGQRQAAIDSGVVKGFKLLLSSDPCPKCIAQAAKGIIPLDGSFSLGEGTFADQLLPVHPNCECSIEEVIDIRA